MVVDVHGVRYPLSEDYGADTGAEWTWDRAVPDCPACGDTLTVRDGSRVVMVSSPRPYVWQVVCACGFEGRMHDALPMERYR